MTDVIKHMRDRFLAWRLPEDFAPDGGIEFSQRGPHGPTGTNLFTAVQAEAMIRHMLECAPAASQPVAEIHRSFPDAADGRPMSPMGDALMTAGLNIEDARFVAIQLARNGLAMVPTPAPVVPAEGLERAREDEAKAGWALDMELLKELRSAAGDWGYSLDLEAVEAIALEVEKRLRAQQPAPPGSGVTVQEAQWTKTADWLPKKPGLRVYEQIECLIRLPNGDIKVSMWNCEHLCWDDEDGDDFRYDPGHPTHWMPLAPLRAALSALEGK